MQTCFYAAIFHFQSFLMLVAQLSSPPRVAVVKTVILEVFESPNVHFGAATVHLD